MSEGNQLKRAASADSGSEAQHRSKNACVRDAQEGTDEAKGTCCSAPDKTGSPQGGQVVELAAFVNATSCAAGAPLRSVESTGDPHGDDSEPDSPRLNLLVGSVPEPAGDLDALLLGPGVDTSAPRLDQDAPLGGPDTTSEALMQDGEQSAVNQQQEVDMHVESAGQVVGGRAAPAVPSEELPLQSCQVVAHTTTAADAAATDPAAGPVLEDAGPTPADAGAAAPVAAAASPDAAAAVTPAAAADDDGTGPAHDDDNDASVENDDHDNDDGNGEDDEAAKAHAYSALLADLHQAAWAQRFPSRLQWAALIAPNRPWDTCPGPDQCSIVLDTETSGLPRWVRACIVLPSQGTGAWSGRSSDCHVEGPSIGAAAVVGQCACTILKMTIAVTQLLIRAWAGPASMLTTCPLHPPPCIGQELQRLDVHQAPVPGRVRHVPHRVGGVAGAGPASWTAAPAPGLPAGAAGWLGH